MGESGVEESRAAQHAPNDRSATDPDDVRQLADGQLSPATTHAVRQEHGGLGLGQTLQCSFDPSDPI